MDPILRRSTMTMLLRRLFSRAGISRSGCNYYHSAGNLSHESATNLLISSRGGSMPPSVGGGELVGCSHGWSALFNKRSNDLYLSDPLSRRRINLPPIDTLPDPDFNLDLHGHGSISKVVLSSSPDEDECRAMMTFGPANRLAYCVPGRSSEWIPIGHLFFEHKVKDPFLRYARVHDDLVYCARRRVFTSVTSCHLDVSDLLWGFCTAANDVFSPEKWEWDIQDADSPKVTKPGELDGRMRYDEEWEKSPTRRWVEEEREVLENECVQIPHLVYAEESDRLFLAMRFVRSKLGYVPRCEVRGLRGVLEGNTFGFIVVEIKEERDMHGFHVCTMQDDLNGMAMFVGIDQSSSAISHTFNPNSIYFTDAKRIPKLCTADDIGVFDYAAKTISAGASGL